MTFADAARITVAENAANGTPLDSGWAVPTATQNLASAAIDGTNGEITVTTTAVAGGGSVIFVPTADAGAALVSGTIPSGRLDGTARRHARGEIRPAQCR
jgi:type IV pilus assembly protein PilA